MEINNFNSMVTQQLLDYIKQQLGQGISKEQIKSILLGQGWQEDDIESGFRKVEAGKTEKQVETNSQKSLKRNLLKQEDGVERNNMLGNEVQKSNVEVLHSENSLRKFKGSIQLLKESWYLYRQKIKILLGIAAFPVVFSYLSWLLTYYLSNTSLRYSFWFSVIVAILYSVSFFLWLWFFPSIVYSLKEDIGLKESYQKGLKIIISYIWVAFLSSALIIGGTLFFVAPGFLFLIWFSLSIFVLVDNGKKGMEALFGSKDLIKGKFWGVVGRYLVLFLIVLGCLMISILGLILLFIKIPSAKVVSLINVTGINFASIFIWPFVMVYLFLIYSNLKEIKSEVSIKNIDGKLNKNLNEELGQSNKKSKLKYVFYIIPGILGTLVIGIIFTVHSLNIFLGRDIPPINDSDLWLSKVEIPKEENAFYDLQQASEKLSIPEGKWSIGEIAEGKKWDSNLAKKLINNNQEALAYFEKASSQPYFQLPQFQDPKTIDIKTKLPVKFYSAVRSMAKLNLIKAKYLFRQGKQKEAIETMIKTIKVGQLMQKSPNSDAINYLLGIAIKEIGLKGLRGIIPNLNLPSPVLRNYVAELSQFGTNNDGLNRVLKMGYVSRINTQSEIEKKLIKRNFYLRLGEESKIGLNYYYKSNQTQKIIVDYYRSAINNSDKDCYEMNLSKIKDPKPWTVVNFDTFTPHFDTRMLFTNNLVGKIFYNTGIVSPGLLDLFTSITRKKCLINFSARGTQLLMAVKAYQIDHHQLSVRLNDLVPKYISKIPVDPFSGKPIKYLPQKRVIYTVGPDQKDSSGSQGGDWQKMKDPTFKIEF